jgi:hypothetical protein
VGAGVVFRMMRNIVGFCFDIVGIIARHRRHFSTSSPASSSGSDGPS